MDRMQVIPFRHRACCERNCTFRWCWEPASKKRVSRKQICWQLARGFRLLLTLRKLRKHSCRKNAGQFRCMS